ncbi:hypothetical protein BHE74_00044482, partial [Ensete ventricosum]
MFHLYVDSLHAAWTLHQVPPKLLRLLICIELMVVLVSTIPRVSPSLSPISTSTLSVPSYDVAMVASPLDLVMHRLMHYLIRDHATTPRCSLDPLRMLLPRLHEKLVVKLTFVRVSISVTDCLLGYQTHFGNFSDWCVLVCTGVLTHGTPVHIGGLAKKKKREKGKGLRRNRRGWREEGRRKKWRKKKKEKEEKSSGKWQGQGNGSVDLAAAMARKCRSSSSEAAMARQQHLTQEEVCNTDGYRPYWAKKREKKRENLESDTALPIQIRCPRAKIRFSPDPDPSRMGDFFAHAIHRPRAISSPRVGRKNISPRGENLFFELY